MPNDDCLDPELCSPETLCPPCEQTEEVAERRERYAAAIVRYDDVRSQRVASHYAKANARRLRAELDDTRAEIERRTRVARENYNETARLLAELEEKGRFLTEYRQQNHKLETTIARVEAVLTEWYGSDESHGQFARDVFDALRGETP